MAWAIRAAVCWMRLEVLSHCSTAKFQPGSCEGAPWKTNEGVTNCPTSPRIWVNFSAKRAANASFTTLAVGSSSGFFQARMTRKWKRSYEKLQHGLKTIFETRISTFFPKKNLSLPFPLGFFLVQSKHLFLQSLRALDFVQTLSAFNKRHGATNAQLPESCVLLQVFLNDLRSMFCLALLEAWCFPIQLWNFLDRHPKKRGDLNDTE